MLAPDVASPLVWDRRTYDRSVDDLGLCPMCGERPADKHAAHRVAVSDRPEQMFAEQFGEQIEPNSALP